jgi:Fur family ferric uptake transcriptional regulator
MTALNARFEEECRKAGLRLTGQRKLVARILAESADHPDVEELHRRALAIDSRVSLATVYRTVRLLEELRIVERHAFGNGRARFEKTADAHHDHLIDVTTGGIIEFQSEEIERLQREIARKLGYRLVGHRLELYAKPIRNRNN